MCPVGLNEQLSTCHRTHGDLLEQVHLCRKLGKGLNGKGWAGWKKGSDRVGSKVDQAWEVGGINGGTY